MGLLRPARLLTLTVFAMVGALSGLAACERADGPSPRAIPQCTPACVDRECGADLCGGTCGECKGDILICDVGLCVTPACIPQCGDALCGDDGCGGSCGACPASDLCREGVCGPADCDAPNACSVAPDIACVGNTKTTYSAPGTCSVVAETPTCAFPIGDETDCAATGDICKSGACVPATEGASTGVVSSLRVVVPTDPEECCVDYDGDDDLDNHGGELLPAIDFGTEQLVGADGLNGLVSGSVESGAFLMAVELEGVDNVTNDDEITVHLLEAYTENGAAPAYDGNDLIRLMPRSFTDDTHTAARTVLKGHIENGVLTTEPGAIIFSIVIGATELVIPLQETQITATVTQDAKGITLSNGRLGAAMRLDDLYTVLNNYAAGACECLSLGDEVFIGFTGEGFDAECSDAIDSVGCTGLCELLGGACGAAILALSPDITIQGGADDNALSLGLVFTVTSATIVDIGENTVHSGCSGGCGGGTDDLATGLLQGLLAGALLFWLVRRRRQRA